MLKRTIKIIAIILGVVIVIVLGAIGVALNYILTPEKLTPATNLILKEYVSEEAHVAKVELTFFSTFPNFSAQIDSLSIKQQVDSIPDFISAKKCIVKVNPIAYLFKKEVVVTNVSLEKPNIYIYADHKRNSLDLINKLIESEEGAKEEEETSTEKIDIKGITLKKIAIDSANFTIDDRAKSVFAQLSDYNLKLKGDFNSKIMSFDIATDWQNLLLWQEGNLVANNISASLTSEMEFVRESLLLNIENTALTINNISLAANGTLKGNSKDSLVAVNINAGLTTPSLEEFLKLIPANIVSDKEKITTTGSVSLNAKLQGNYSKTSMPTLTADLLIENASAKYSSKKTSIDDVNCKANLFVDLNNPEASYLNVEKFTIETMGIIKLDSNLKATNIIKNPAITTNLNTHINFNLLVELFPLQDGIILEGENNTNITARFLLNDIRSGNYAKMVVDGESLFTNLTFSIDGSKLTGDENKSFIFAQIENGELLFGNKSKISESPELTSLNASIGFNGIGFRNEKKEYALVKDINLSCSADIDKMTQEIKGLKTELGLKGIALGLEDTIDVKMKQSDLVAIIIPKNEQGELFVDATLKSDSISAKEISNNTDATMSLAGARLMLTNKDKMKWMIKGTVGFQNLSMYTDLFPIPVKVAATEVGVTNNEISLKSARIKIGESNVVATGKVENLLSLLFGSENTFLKGNLDIASSMLNLNELLEASNQGIERLEAVGMTQQVDSFLVLEPVKNDSLESPMILVPKNMDLALNLNLDKVKFDKMVIENIVGEAVLKDGVVSMNKISLNAIGAKAQSSIVYSNISQELSKAYIDIDLKKVDISRIGELLPAIDTIMPMIKNFEGIIDFGFRAVTDVDQDMNIIIPTMKAAISIEGTNLVLLDNETFKQASKLLMFKNKNRNVIDSLGVHAVVQDSKVDVYPFEVEMDRYRAIIGGTQDINIQNGELTLDFKYNISIVKSPLPFKAGVDIYGDLNDLSFKITKAKLKKSDFETLSESYEAFKDKLKPEQ